MTPDHGPVGPSGTSVRNSSRSTGRTLGGVSPSPGRAARRRSLSAVAAIAVLAAPVASTPALAHTSIASTSPRDGVVVAAPPAAVVVTYAEALGAVEGGEVRSGGRTLSGPARIAAADVRRVVIPIRADPAPAGGYVATWSVVGADGHTLEGSISFRVRPAPAGARLRSLGARIARAAAAVEAAVTSR
jgi:copper transport protein